MDAALLHADTRNYANQYSTAGSRQTAADAQITAKVKAKLCAEGAQVKATSINDFCIDRSWNRELKARSAIISNKRLLQSSLPLALMMLRRRRI